MIKFYGYNKCSTCRKAKQVLEKKKIKFEDIEIVDNPPAKSLLQAILKSGEYKLSDLFNKSGELYREFNMKDKIKTLSESEALDLLAKHGKLVKRPIVTDGKRATVGFKEETFGRFWS